MIDLRSEACQLLTFADAARVLGISLRQVRRLVDGGQIAFVRVSERAPRIKKNDLDAFISAATVTHNEP